MGSDESEWPRSARIIPVSVPKALSTAPDAPKSREERG